MSNTKIDYTETVAYKSVVEADPRAREYNIPENVDWSKVPVVKNIDAEIWDQVKNDKSKFEMGVWHFNLSEFKEDLKSHVKKQTIADKYYDFLTYDDYYNDPTPIDFEIGAQDLLSMSSKKRSCGTAHCRAGWATTLAGKKGLELEAEYDAPTAAALIYIKSRPDEPVPDFYCDNDEALDDIKACARRQRRRK